MKKILSILLIIINLISLIGCTNMRNTEATSQNSIDKYENIIKDFADEKEYNIAFVSSTKLDDGTVESYVGHYSTLYKLENYCFDSIVDEEWTRIEKSNKGKRKKNRGWVIYHLSKNKEKMYYISTKTKTFYVPNMLDYLCENIIDEQYKRNKKYWVYKFIYKIGV